MKKSLIILFVFIIITGVFTACTKKDDGSSLKPASTTFYTYEAVTSYFNQSNEDKTIVYEDKNSNVVQIDIEDSQGNLLYSEEYLYSADGSIYGYNYYNKAGLFVARYVPSGEDKGFFYSDGTPMSESDFSKRLDEIQNPK